MNPSSHIEMFRPTYTDEYEFLVGISGTPVEKNRLSSKDESIHGITRGYGRQF